LKWNLSAAAKKISVAKTKRQPIERLPRIGLAVSTSASELGDARGRPARVERSTAPSTRVRPLPAVNASRNAPGSPVRADRGAAAFALMYRRGELPVIVEHRAGGNVLSWQQPIDTLDVEK
jgi:hypothetical protein